MYGGWYGYIKSLLAYFLYKLLWSLAPINSEQVKISFRIFHYYQKSHAPCHRINSETMIQNILWFNKTERMCFICDVTKLERRWPILHGTQTVSTSTNDYLLSMWVLCCSSFPSWLIALTNNVPMRKN